MSRTSNNPFENIPTEHIRLWWNNSELYSFNQLSKLCGVNLATLTRYMASMGISNAEKQSWNCERELEAEGWYRDAIEIDPNEPVKHWFDKIYCTSSGIVFKKVTTERYNTKKTKMAEILTVVEIDGIRHSPKEIVAECWVKEYYPGCKVVRINGNPFDNHPWNLAISDK